MGNIGKRIKALRLRLGLSQSEFAIKSKVSVGGICEIEKGKRGLTDKTIMRICKAFNIDPRWLLTGEEKRRDIPSIVAEPRTEYNQKKLIAVPVINEVPAGYPAYPDIEDHVRSHVYLPNVPKRAFGLYISGKSMEPEINDGDIVIVDPGYEEIKKGELGVFRVNGEATIKYCTPIEDGYILQPANRDYGPILITGDTECTLIGKVIYKIIKC